MSSGKRSDDIKIPLVLRGRGFRRRRLTGGLLPPPDSSLLLCCLSIRLLAGDGVLGALQRGAQAEGLPHRLLRRDQDLLREIRGEYPCGRGRRTSGGAARLRVSVRLSQGSHLVVLADTPVRREDVLTQKRQILRLIQTMTPHLVNGFGKPPLRPGQDCGTAWPASAPPPADSEACCSITG